MKNSGFLFFPELVRIAKMFPKLSKWQNLVDAARPIHKLVENAVMEHENHIPDEQQPRNLIDAYINEINNCTDPASTFYKDIGRKILKKCYFLFVFKFNLNNLTLLFFLGVQEKT